MRKSLFNSLWMTASLFAVTGTALAQTDVTATYIKNPGFESGTAVTGNVRTYARDKQTNETSGLQEVTDWTIVDNGDAKAGGVFAYGNTSIFIGGSDYLAPATAATGGGDNALGILAVWSSSAQYTQAVTLPAGTYTLKADVYNSKGGTTAAAKCLFGFVSDDNEEYFAKSETYAANTWKTISVEFTLAKATSGKFSIGYTAVNSGNANQQHLFFDNLTLTYQGASLEEYYTNINSRLNTAKAIEGKMNSNDSTALVNAIKAGEAAVSEPKVTATDQLDKVISDLDAAITAANASVKVYAAAKVYLDAASSLDEAGQKNYADDATVLALQDAYVTRYLESITAEQETALAEALRTAAKAQTTAGADMTLAIVNPDFETGDITGWTTTNSNDTGAKSTTNNTYKMTNSSGAYLFNTWLVGTPITQTVTGLQPGKYTVKAIMATDASKTLVLTANGTEATVASVEKGTGVEVVNSNVIVTNGSLEISAGTSDKYWYKADNFRLTFVEAISIADLYTKLNELIKSAEAITGDMNKDASTALANALNAGKAVNQDADNNYDDVNKIVNTLQDAVGAAKESVDAYAAAKTELDKRTTTINNLNSNLYTADAYATYYTTPWGKYNAGTLTSEEAKALPESTSWRNAVQFNSFLGSAFGVTSYNDVPYINTWSTEGDKDDSNFSVPFFEYFTGNANTLGDKTLTATITGLEAGEYVVSAWVRVRLSDSKTAPATGITFKANGGEAATITGKQIQTSQLYLDEYTVYGTVGEDGKLEISFDVASTNVSWLSFKNVNYVKVESATLTEATGVEPLTKLAGKPVDVSFTREFTSGVSSTVCLPFEATPDASAGKFYAFTGVTGTDGEYTVTMSETATTLAANTPYLFVPAATGKVEFTGTVAEAAKEYTPKDVTVDEWTFAGAYSKVTYDEDSKWGDYAAIYGFVAKDLSETPSLNPGEFVKMKKPGSSYTPAFRAVMKYKAASSEGGAEANVRGSIALPSSLQVVLVDADGTITEIGTVDVDTDTSDSSWYTIDGRKLQGQPSVKGIYINSGKKILIK